MAQTTTKTRDVARNKEAAVEFLRMVVANKVRDAYAKFVATDAVSHNPYFGGSRDELMRAMEDAHKQNPNTTIDVKRVIAEGDLVAVHSHVRHKPGSRGAAVVHIFRFGSDGKVVEFWDLGQEVPDTSPNRNGMF